MNGSINHSLESICIEYGDVKHDIEKTKNNLNIIEDEEETDNFWLDYHKSLKIRKKNLYFKE